MSPVQRHSWQFGPRRHLSECVRAPAKLRSVPRTRWPGNDWPFGYVRAANPVLRRPPGLARGVRAEPQGEATDARGAPGLLRQGRRVRRLDPRLALKPTEPGHRGTDPPDGRRSVMKVSHLAQGRGRWTAPRRSVLPELAEPVDESVRPHLATIGPHDANASGGQVEDPLDDTLQGLQAAVGPRAAMAEAGLQAFVVGHGQRATLLTGWEAQSRGNSGHDHDRRPHPRPGGTRDWRRPPVLSGGSTQADIRPGVTWKR
jgi:hypothetical protein